MEQSVYDAQRVRGVLGSGKALLFDGATGTYARELPGFPEGPVELSCLTQPQRVLELCLGIEQQLGRTRTGEYGAPRTCDIDILYYGTLEQSGPELTLPHPRAYSRLFVLRPLCDIDPLLVLPGQTRTVQQLAEALPNQPAVVPFPI